MDEFRDETVDVGVSGTEVLVGVGVLVETGVGVLVGTGVGVLVGTGVGSGCVDTCVSSLLHPIITRIAKVLIKDT